MSVMNEDEAELSKRCVDRFVEESPFAQRFINTFCEIRREEEDHGEVDGEGEDRDESQASHKTVNLLFILVIIKDKLTDL